MIVCMTFEGFTIVYIIVYASQSEATLVLSPVMTNNGPIKRYIDDPQQEPKLETAATEPLSLLYSISI